MQRVDSHTFDFHSKASTTFQELLPINSFLPIVAGSPVLINQDNNIIIIIIIMKDFISCQQVRAVANAIVTIKLLATTTVDATKFGV